LRLIDLPWYGLPLIIEKKLLQHCSIYVLAAIINRHNLKTTLCYLHVTNKDLMNFLSPLEDIKDFL